MARHSRARLVKAFDALQEANDGLRRELVRHKRTMNKVVRQLSAETMMPEDIKAQGVPEIREAMTDALERFEKARHDARIAVFAHQTAVPGVTGSDLARALGISRQLASRLAQEAAG